jgi:hypothetical protein
MLGYKAADQTTLRTEYTRPHSLRQMANFAEEKHKILTFESWANLMDMQVSVDI